MVASVIFPVGGINDMFVFLFAGGFAMMPLGMLMGHTGVPAEPWSTFAMTISQGVALNLQMAIAVTTLTLIGRARPKVPS